MTSYCASPLPANPPADAVHGSTILITREAFDALPKVSNGDRKPGTWRKMRIGARWYAIDPGGELAGVKFGNLVMED